MNKIKILDTAKTLVGKIVAAHEEEDDCGLDIIFVDPDDFNNFSDYDSLMVDSKEGAPE